MSSIAANVPVDRREPAVSGSVPLRIVGLTNDLRSDSYNFMTLKAVGQAMAPAMNLSAFDIKQIPFFEPAIDPATAPLSDVMRAFERTLHAAAGLVVAVPEYNHSIPGRLKNALDMVSRLVSQPMAGMPVMIISAATGRLGGARAQYDLRRVLDSMGAISLIRPEVFIGEAGSKFNSEGECIDRVSLDFIRSEVEAFAHLIASTRVDRTTRR